MLALDMSVEAADERVLTLMLPSIVTDPVPGTEVDVPVTVVDGYTNEDLINAVQITIEYDSSVAVPKNATIGDGIVIDFETFGISPIEWLVNANITAEQVTISMINFLPFPPLSEPIGGFPAVLLTIKFIVQTDDPNASTDLLFVDDVKTYFLKRNFDRLLLDGDTVNGSISFTEAQGSINGIVIDWAGNPIEWALVIAILGEPKGKDFTDDEGYYEISGLEPGIYWVLCIKRGYKLGIRREVEVIAGEETTVNFRLRPKPE